MTAPHKHYWNYPHRQIEGRKPSETAVIRYCKCGRREVSFASRWQEAKGDYALDEHYQDQP